MFHCIYYSLIVGEALSIAACLFYCPSVCMSIWTAVT